MLDLPPTATGKTCYDRMYIVPQRTVGFGAASLPQ